MVDLEYDAAERAIQDIIVARGSGLVVQNVVDFLFEHFDMYSWIGIYVVHGKELVLGPWRGDKETEHTRIPIGKGICGSAALSGKTEIVDDVSKDERYLACFVSTRSEIVVPIKRNGIVVGEIDIDSDVADAFTNDDAVFLEKVANMLSQHI